MPHVEHEDLDVEEDELPFSVLCSVHVDGSLRLRLFSRSDEVGNHSNVQRQTAEHIAEGKTQLERSVLFLEHAKIQIRLSRESSSFSCLLDALLA